MLINLTFLFIFDYYIFISLKV